MSEAVAAPSPANGMTGPSPSQPTITSLPPIPRKAEGKVDPGPNTAPGQPVRGADGKFAATKPEPEKKPAPAVDDDPEFDLGDGTKMKRSQLKSELGRARSSSKMLTEARREKEEAAKIRAEAESKRTKYADNLDALFEEAGITDPEERARRVSKYLHEKFIAPESMTAEQRALAERDAKIAGYEAEKKQAAETAQKAEYEKVSAAEDKRLRSQISAALKAGSIPQSPLAVKRIAERIAAFEETYAKDPNPPDVSIEEVARLVRDETASDTADILLKSSMDDLAALWGQEKFAGIVTRLVTEKGVDGLRRAIGHEPFKAIAKMFAEYGTSLLKGVQAQPQRVPVQSAPKPEQYMTPQEFAMRRK